MLIEVFSSRKEGIWPQKVDSSAIFLKISNCLRVILTTNTSRYKEIYQQTEKYT